MKWLLDPRSPINFRTCRRASMTDDSRNSREVLIVAANKWAYECFRKYSAYICQTDRSFRPEVDRIGYSCEGAIQAEFPTILERRDHVGFNYETSRKLQLSGNPFDAAFATIIERAIADGRDNIPGQVFLLSPPDSRLTLRIAQPITNTERSETGRPIAWTQGHRYVQESAILAGPRTTDELAEFRATDT